MPDNIINSSTLSFLYKELMLTALNDQAKGTRNLNSMIPFSCFDNNNFIV